MGRNQILRRQLAGQRQALAEHRAKLELELKRPNPDHYNVKRWRDTIRNVESQIVKLERRFERER